MFIHLFCLCPLGLTIKLNLVTHSFYEMRLQGIMVVVFIILDWMFVLMNTTTMIPCRRISWRPLWNLKFRFFFGLAKISAAIFVNTCFSPPLG